MKSSTKTKHSWAVVLRAIVRETSKFVEEGRLMLVASSLAYTTLLSLVPLLAVSFAIFKAFGGLDKVYGTIEPVILNTLAEGSGKEVVSAIRGFIDNVRGSVIGAGGLVGLLVTCVSMFSSAEKAINQVWGTKVKRTFFQRMASYWFFITLGPVGFAVAIGVTSSASQSVGTAFQKLLPSGFGTFVLAWLVFYLIYRYVPNVRVKAKAAAVGSGLMAVAWTVVRAFYGLYTHKVLSYSRIYGSLGAVPILLLWIYILWLILLSGVAITAAVQKVSEEGVVE